MSLFLSLSFDYPSFSIYFVETTCDVSAIKTNSREVMIGLNVTVPSYEPNQLFFKPNFNCKPKVRRKKTTEVHNGSPFRFVELPTQLTDTGKLS